MPATYQPRQPNTGLSALAKQDYYARLKRQNDQKFLAVLALRPNISGGRTAGRIAISEIAHYPPLAQNKSSSDSQPVEFVIAVLQLYGYIVEHNGTHLVYAKLKD